jgi:hypothetical protein
MIDVSVITPTFRREREVVESVRSALGQARHGVSVEVIVLDDSPEGSAREGVEGIGDPRVRYLKREIPSKGRPAIVRNEGVKLARGRYVHFLDDDDRLADGASKAMVAALDARPDAGVAVGWVVPFGDDPVALEEKRSYFARAAKIGASTPSSLRTVATIMFKGTLMVNSACMIRRELVEPDSSPQPTAATASHHGSAQLGRYRRTPTTTAPATDAPTPANTNCSRCAPNSGVAAITASPAARYRALLLTANRNTRVRVPASCDAGGWQVAGENGFTGRRPDRCGRRDRERTSAEQPVRTCGAAGDIRPCWRRGGVRAAVPPRGRRDGRRVARQCRDGVGAGRRVRRLRHRVAGRRAGVLRQHHPRVRGR